MADRELLLERLERLAIVLDELMPQCAELVRDAIVLLKEQEAVVRCKDCKHWYFADNRIPSEQENVCGRNGIIVTPDWYCADGERKDE